MTTGQQLATELRKQFRIGTRTRWSRLNGTRCSGPEQGRRWISNEILSAIDYPEDLPADVRELYRAAFAGPLVTWEKHIESGRADTFQTLHLRGLSPWQFTKFLGEMLDAGITNTGQGERWLHARREQDRDAYAAHLEAREACWRRHVAPVGTAQI